MRTNLWTLLLGLSATLFVITACYGEAEMNSKEVQLPAPAKQAIEKAYPGLGIQKAKVETENGNKLYEVKLGLEVKLAEDGTIVEVESQLPVSDLPKTVIDAAAKAAPKAKIEKAKKEQILTDSKLNKLPTPTINYSLEVKQGDKEGELTISADGTVVEPLKWEKEEKEEKKKEVKASKAELPAAAAKAFKDAFPKGKIEKLDVDNENGVTVYDIEFKNGPAEQETDITADGTILEVTLVVEAKDVPAAAMKAIEKAAEGAKIKRIENIEISYETKDGKAVKLTKPVMRFAAEFAKGNKTTEVVVTPDGTLVKE